MNLGQFHGRKFEVMIAVIEEALPAEDRLLLADYLDGAFLPERELLASFVETISVYFARDERLQLAALIREQDAMNRDIHRLIPIYPVQSEANEDRGMYLESRCSVCRNDYIEQAGPGEQLTGLCLYHRPQNVRMAV